MRFLDDAARLSEPQAKHMLQPHANNRDPESWKAAQTCSFGADGLANCSSLGHFAPDLTLHDCKSHRK